MKRIYQYRMQCIRQQSFMFESKLADRPQAVWDIMQQLCKDSDRERFWSIALDAANKVIGIDVVSVGTLTATLVHPREVFKFCIKANAAGVIVCHNHPSGDPEPSREDRETTRRISEAGKILGIPLLDHVILGESRYFSFRERGLLDA